MPLLLTSLTATSPVTATKLLLFCCYSCYYTATATATVFDTSTTTYIADFTLLHLAFKQTATATAPNTGVATIIV
jgi:hypothetical protein